MQSLRVLRCAVAQHIRDAENSRRHSVVSSHTACAPSCRRADSMLASNRPPQPSARWAGATTIDRSRRCSPWPCTPAAATSSARWLAVHARSTSSRSSVGSPAAASSRCHAGRHSSIARPVISSMSVMSVAHYDHLDTSYRIGFGVDTVAAKAMSPCPAILHRRCRRHEPSHPDAAVAGIDRRAVCDLRHPRRMRRVRDARPTRTR